jgi:hypothetical protein
MNRIGMLVWIGGCATAPAPELQVSSADLDIGSDPAPQPGLNACVDRMGQDGLGNPRVYVSSPEMLYARVQPATTAWVTQGCTADGNPTFPTDVSCVMKADLENQTYLGIAAAGASFVLEGALPPNPYAQLLDPDSEQPGYVQDCLDADGAVLATVRMGANTVQGPPNADGAFYQNFVCNASCRANLAGSLGEATVVTVEFNAFNQPNLYLPPAAVPTQVCEQFKAYVQNQNMILGAPGTADCKLQTSRYKVKVGGDRAIAWQTDNVVHGPTSNTTPLPPGYPPSNLGCPDGTTQIRETYKFKNWTYDAAAPQAACDAAVAGMPQAQLDMQCATETEAQFGVSPVATVVCRGNPPGGGGQNWASTKP